MLRERLASLLELPIVGDLRGVGWFYALELVNDKESKETFTDEESESLLRGFLSPEMFRRGLICRADDRGDPVVQISLPLVAGAGRDRRAGRDPRRRAHRGLGAGCQGRESGPGGQRGRFPSEIRS